MVFCLSRLGGGVGGGGSKEQRSLSVAANQFKAPGPRHLLLRIRYLAYSVARVHCAQVVSR